MTKKGMKKTTAFLAAILMIFTAACAEKNSSKNNEGKTAPITQTMYKEERIILPEDYNSLEQMRYIAATDKYYLIYRSMSGDYSLCILDGDFAVESTKMLCAKENNTQSIFRIGEEGEIEQMKYYAAYDGAENAEFDSADFYENAEITFSLARYDSMGELVSETEIDGLKEHYEPVKSRFSEFVKTSDNNYIVNFYTGLVKFDENGNILDYYETSEGTDYLGIDSYGRAVTGTSNKITYLEEGSLTPSEEAIETPQYVFLNASPQPGADGYKMFLRMNEGFFGLTEDNEFVKIMDYVSSNIFSSDVYDLKAGAQGELIMYCVGNSSQYVAKLTVRPDDYVENKQPILLGAEDMALDDVRAILTQFNKSSDDYEIDVRAYGGDYDQFAKDLLTDDAPDVFMYSQSAYMYKYANAGVYADMYDYMEKYGGLAKEDIRDNVLQAFEYRDGLYGICSEYQINSYIANSEVVGKEYTNWSFDEMYEFARNMPEDMYFGNNMDFNTREAVFGLAASDAWIDYENFTCNFEDESFIEYLEFCRDTVLMPEIDWSIINQDDQQPIINEQITMLSNKMALIQNARISDLASIMNEADRMKLYPEDWTFVGSPTNERAGVISTNRIYSVVANSDTPEGAWEFIKFIMSPQYQEDSYGAQLGEFVTRKDSFEKIVYKFQNMPEIEGVYRYYRSLSDEAYEVFMPYLDSCSKLYYHNGFVTYIMLEEFNDFMEGSITAQECAERIQSRVSIYLAETK